MKDMNITPNKMLLGYLMQTAMKKSDTNMIIDALEQYLVIGHEPDDRLLKKLG